jgi:hypothetical protein
LTIVAVLRPIRLVVLCLCPIGLRRLAMSARLLPAPLSIAGREIGQLIVYLCRRVVYLGGRGGFLASPGRLRGPSRASAARRRRRVPSWS